MTRPIPTLLVMTCVAMVASCGRDEVLEPEVRSWAWFRLLPTEAVLTTTAPANTVQLTVEAFDRAGQRVPDPGVVTYSSGDASVADVSSSGLVTAVAHGAVTITATLTSGDATGTASMDLWVFEPVTLAINGVYDLTATIERFDPAWGYDLTGWGYAAVLTFQQDTRYTPGTAGTFSGFRLTGPEGDEGPGVDGVIHVHRYWTGRVVIELVAEHFRFELFPTGDLLEPILKGTFGAGGHISGTFIVGPRAED
jgi:hypothetical protein